MAVLSLTCREYSA